MSNQNMDIKFIKRIREQLRKNNITVSREQIENAGKLLEIEVTDISKEAQTKIVEYIEQHKDETGFTNTEDSESSFIELSTQVPEPQLPKNTGSMVASTAQNMGLELTRAETLSITQQIAANKQSNVEIEEQIYKALVAFIEREELAKSQKQTEIISSINNYAHNLRFEREQNLVKDTNSFLRQLQTTNSEFATDFVKSIESIG